MKVSNPEVHIPRVDSRIIGFAKWGTRRAFNGRS